MEIKPDVKASVRFLSTEEGGRQTPTPTNRFGCIFTVGKENFDCFLLVNETGPIEPGQQLSVRMKFLCPDLVKPKLKKGTEFLLRDYRVFGKGTIDEIYE